MKDTDEVQLVGETTKLRCHLYKDQVEDWADALRNPSKSLKRWTCAALPQMRGQFQDTWGFEVLSDTPFAKGLFRVWTAAAKHLLAESGKKYEGMRWYVEPVTYSATIAKEWEIKTIVQWIDQHDDEGDKAYMIRAVGLTGNMLTRGLRQVGIRR